MNKRFGAAAPLMFFCVFSNLVAGCGSSGSTNRGGGTTDNPLPSITTLSPSGALVNGSTVTLTITGAGFINSSQAQWNGTALTTTYVSGTSVTAQVPASDMSATGSNSVTVTNPAPGGGTSNAVTFSVSNPAPKLASISPTNANVAGAAFTLTAAGSDFVSSSVIQWNGTALATTFASATGLTAQVPATDLAVTGSFNVSVANPAPGGGTSTLVAFLVNNPAPVLMAIAPNTAIAGSAALTLTATGSNFLTGSVINWNGMALATTYVSATKLTAQVPATDLTGGTSANVTVLNPTPGGGASGGLAFSIVAPSTHMVTINLPANDIVWDSTHARIYASLPSSDTNGNSVVAIDPVSAIVGTPVGAGSEPHPLALSDYNSFLYVGLDGTGQIERFSLPGLTLDTNLNLQLPVDPTFGQQVAMSLAVVPGAPHSVAAILANYSWSGPNTGGTRVYDDATQRASFIPYYSATDWALAWGADANTLYGSNGVSSGNDLYVFSSNSSGLTLTSDYGYLVPTQYGKLHFDPVSGYIYMDGGRVVDAKADTVIGTFNMGELVGYQAPRCALDVQNGVVFFLGQTLSQFNNSSGVTIEAFDLKTYRLLGTLPIPGIAGHPADFLRWGNAGLAFNMSLANSVELLGSGPIYLMDGSFVNAQNPADFSSGVTLNLQPSLTAISPQSAGAGAADTTLVVTGRNFSSDSQVMWNGTALPTVATSGTELQATIASANLAAVGTALVSVTNTSSSLSTADSLAFTILPASGTTSLMAINLASHDVAWDAKASQLIVPVWSADPQYPNSILQIDPTNGSITGSTSVPSDPDLVRVTGDGASLYVGFSTINAVNELSLPSLSTTSSFVLGSDSFFGPLYAYDLQPAPGAPQTTAVAFGWNGAQPPEGDGMTIYDSGVARATSAATRIGFINIQWSPTTSLLYAADNASGLYAYGVNATGLTLQSHNLITSGTSTLEKIHFDAGTGYLYDDDGEVIDPATGAEVGNYGASGLADPDSSLNRVFILGQLSSQTGTNNYTIQSFNQTTFAPAGSITLTGLVGSPVAFVRWGTSGLALVTYNQTFGVPNTPAGMLYIVNDSTFVSAAAEPAAGGAQEERVRAFGDKRAGVKSAPSAH